MAAHRHWRLYITATGGDPNYTQIAELELRAAIGGADQTGAGTASALTALSGFEASKAVDNTTSSKWSTTVGNVTPTWIAYDFGAGNDVDIVEVAVACAGTAFDARGPRVFDVEWSDDGSTWTTAWSVNEPSLTYTSGVFSVFTSPAARTEAEVSALAGYAVLNYPQDSAGISKLVAYAVVAPVPTVSVGQVLGYSGDAWTNEPTSFLSQWQRDGVDISGATGTTYTLVGADEGAMIRHKLIAVNDDGSSEPVYSVPVGPVGP